MIKDAQIIIIETHLYSFVSLKKTMTKYTFLEK